MWLGGVMVGTLDLWLAVAGSIPSHATAWLFLRYVTVNSALHPSMVAKPSTSFGWGKGGKDTTAGWQVSRCDPIWRVISRSDVVISITNCNIQLTYITHRATVNGKQQHSKYHTLRMTSIWLQVTGADKEWTQLFHTWISCRFYWLKSSLKSTWNEYGYFNGCGSTVSKMTRKSTSWKTP